MLIESASVYVRQGKAYLPVMARTEAGLSMGIEPVHIADLTLESLTTALERVLAAGHPQVPHPAQEEWSRLHRSSPILRVARVRSWREFSKNCASYDLAWTERDVTMYISQLDRLGRAEFASAKKLTFAKDTALRAIVEAILEDVRSRPELLAEGDH